MNRLILVVLLCLGALKGAAQQDAQYTQYMYNTIAINPAYAGSRGTFSAMLLHRSQWVGLDGAPLTQTLNVNSPIGRRLGLGLSIVNDEIGNGTNQDTYFDVPVSYTVPVSEEGKLSFGVKAGGHLLSVDFNKLQNYDMEARGVTATSIDKKFSPNFGAGVYYHTENFYSGLSIPNFLKTEHFDDSGESASYLAQERMNWYFITGYVFEMNRDVKLKPAVLFKAVKGAPLQADLSANVLLRDKFSMGLAYRWDAAVSAMVGFQFSDQFMAGLAYDRETTALGSTRFNDGSFEVFLRYEVFKRVSGTISPRFF